MPNKDLPVYILGPMTGYPQENRPAFKKASAALMDLGHLVVSPDTLDDTCPVGKAKPTWSEYMRRDLSHLALCYAGYALPGWRFSQGAILEATILSRLGCPIYELTLTPSGDVVIPDKPTDRLPTIQMPPPAH